MPPFISKAMIMAAAAAGGVPYVSVSESIPSGSDVSISGSKLYAECNVAFDPNDSTKFVMAYKDSGNSQYGMAVVGTVSGTSISFGTAVAFNGTGGADYNAIAFDPNDTSKFVIAYRDGGNSYYGTAIVGTVSGTSLSFGSEAVFESGDSYNIRVEFNPNTAGKFVIAYSVYPNRYGEAIVGTVSGTSLSFGTAVVFNSGTTDTHISLDFDADASDKFVIAYKDSGNSHYGTAIIGTISGTTPSFGTAAVFNTANTQWVWVSYNAGKIVVVYRDMGSSPEGSGTAIVGTVSGTTITYGSEAVFNSGYTAYTAVSWDPNNQSAEKFVIAYRDYSNSSYATAIVGTVSGTSISYGSEAVLESTASAQFSISRDHNNPGKFVVAYAGNSSQATAILIQVGT